jgi:hypothetical protein
MREIPYLDECRHAEPSFRRLSMLKREYGALAVMLLFVGCSSSGGGSQAADASSSSQAARPTAEQVAYHGSLGERDPASCDGAWGIYVVNMSDFRVELFWAETEASQAQHLGGIAQKDSAIAYFYDARKTLPQVWIRYQGSRMYVDGHEDLSGYRLRAILGCNTEGKKEE